MLCCRGDFAFLWSDDDDFGHPESKLPMQNFYFGFFGFEPRKYLIPSLKLKILMENFDFALNTLPFLPKSMESLVLGVWKVNM